MRTPVKAMLCSKLAIATALVMGATPAAAQSLQGTHSAVGATVNQDTPGLTTVTVNQSQAVINWTANGESAGGLTNFQDAGTTAIFQSATDFAVLNKVSPTVAGDGIFMNGSISSIVGDLTGGTVYFYSPNGIVIGQDASINVGSLGLTTLPIADDGQGNWMTGFGTSAPQVTFGQALNPLSYIRTDTAIDGSINANGLGNYVALVAPRIDHHGIIRTDGGAALVAAAGATITFRTSNLYDIVVTTGSADPLKEGVVVDGGTIERNSEAIGGNRRAYLVAVPANNAMTMLVQGGANLGFDIAGSAGVEGNAVVLSAGRNIFNGDSAGPPNATASATIDNAAFTSNVDIQTTDKLTITSNAGATSFSGALDATAGNAIDISATNNNLSIATILTADASRVGANVTGGDVKLAAFDGNTLSVGGNATLLANGNGFTAVGNNTNAGHGTGGTVLIQAGTGGTLTVGGRLTAHADGLGGSHGFSNGAAGNGTGGLVQLLANDGASTVTVIGRTDLTADGIGGSRNICNTCSIVGGSGTGGMVDVNGAVDADGGEGDANTLNFGGRLFMTAQGAGGTGDAGAGAGQGGESYLSSADGAVINVNNQMFIFADGIGGNHLGSGVGGSGVGGTAGVGSFWGPGGQINIVSGINPAHVTAEGFGGNASLTGGQGGYAEGGSAFVHAPGAAISVTGALYVSAYALGGNATSGTGGAAQGGDSYVRASGPNLLVTTTLEQRAEGMGGDGLVGGAGTGGFVTLQASNNATLTVNDLVSLRAFGEGGDGGFGIGATGGYGDGGQVTMLADTTGDLSLYSLFVDASGDGGAGATGAGAIGGNVSIQALAGSALDVNYQAFVNANGEGGTGYEGNGGAAEGGAITFLADGGLVTVDDSLNLTAWALAGDTEGLASAGGYAEGGQIDVGANAGGTLTVLSIFNASAMAEGGDAVALTSTGGGALGGDVNLRASGVGSTVDARFYLSLDASGSGGGAAGGDCVDCGGGGGDGAGGNVTMQTYGGLGNRILLGDSTLLAANGQGGVGFGGAGGDGLGGIAAITLNDNGLIDTVLNLDLSATGLGGDQYDGGSAGNGVGKEAVITLNGVGSVLDVGGDLALRSQGYGGSVSGADGGIGGSGTGGWSHVYGTVGTGEFRGSVLIDALAMGGDAQLGIGGAAVSGRARLNADGADYHVYGDADIVSTAEGGDGATGGGASAITNPAENSAGIFANSGGTAQIDGSATVNADSIGGAGANGGAGGSAQGGKAWITANGSATGNGTISASSFAVSANAMGGAGGDGLAGDNGGNGGTGGNATAGTAHLLANNSATGANLISGTTATISANGTGGAGGRGGDGLQGGNGGAGGTGTGSFTNALGSSGNGMLTLSSLAMTAIGTGGAGGDGGTAEAGVGGAGGAGGTGDAGSTSFGGNSGLATTLTAGVTTISSVDTDIGSTGGAGGNGGVGTSANGNGGEGGDALGGIATLLVRGGKVDIDAVNVSATASGGNGGAGAIAGNGGDAYVSDLEVNAESRIGDPANGGELVIGTLVMATEANGGTGATAGTSFLTDGHALRVSDSIASFTSYDVTIAGQLLPPDLDPSQIQLVNSAVTVTNGFNIATDGELSVHLDNASLTAGSVSLSAANFIDDEDVGPPGAIGTISADSIALLSGNDFLAEANFASGGSLLIEVGGDINVGGLGAVGQLTLDAGGDIFSDNISGGTLNLFAGGLISTGALTSTVGGISVNGSGSVILDDINSADFFFADTDVNLTIGNLTLTGNADIDIGGDLTTGDIDANDVEFYAGGDIDVGNATVAEEFELEADGAVTVDNVTAGANIGIEAFGAIVAGDLSAGIVNPSQAEGAEYFVGMASATSVSAGNVDAADWVAVATFGTVSVDSIDAGSDVLLLADGNITSGAIATGAENRLLIAGADMLEVGGGTEEFDRSLIFNAVDNGDGIPTSGSATINGAVDSYKVDLLVGGGLTTGAINADDLDASVGGTATINGQWNVDFSTVMRSNDIAIGANGGINGFEIVLASTNPTQTLIGDGLSGVGYALSNAEFGRLDANLLSVFGNSASSAGIDTLVGDLTVRSPGFDYGFVTLGTINPSLTAPDGTIRVVGNVVGNGFAPFEIMTLEADRIEVDAETGSIALGGQEEELGGILILDADQVHVAEQSILDDLADNAAYAGRDQDLATPISEERPDGIIRAAEIYVSFNGGGGQAAGVGTEATPAYSLMVQNVGTNATPAGFVAYYAEVGSSEGTPPGAIDMVVNGQLITEGGTLTGVEVRDALVETNDPERFTATSTINGCALSGPCIIIPIPPPIDPTPDIQTQISLVGGPTSDDQPFGNEEAIEDNEEDGGEDSASSPIQPPAPLFNTRPLEVPGDTDEPVSGGGNPALTGNGANPADGDSDDDEEDE